MNADEELMRYAREGAEEAFATVVQEFGGMVYQAARRQVRDAHLAEDVTQAVFVLLARRAGKIGKGRVAGWLIKTAYFMSKDAQRRNWCREKHERKAGEMAVRVVGPVEMEEKNGMLDGALAKLGQRDRDVVTMRFLMGKSVEEVARAIGATEGAVRKRIERALGKLREDLAEVGPAEGLAAEMGARVARAAMGGVMSVRAKTLVEGAGRRKLAGTLAAGVGVVLVGAGLIWFGEGSKPVVMKNPLAAVKTMGMGWYPVAKGWPVAVAGSVTSTPGLVDLDGDGKPEMVVTCMARAGDTGYAHPKPSRAALVYAFHGDGKTVAGFPVEVVDAETHDKLGKDDLSAEAWFSSPAAIPAGADKKEKIALTLPFGRGVCVIDGAGKVTKYPEGKKLDGFARCIGDARRDGKLESYVLRQGAGVDGLDEAGVELAGWPRKVEGKGGFSPVMGTILAGKEKQVVGAYGDKIYAWTWDGKPVPGADAEGVLISGVEAAEASPTLADLDGDGVAEIAVYDRKRDAVRAWHGDGTPVGEEKDGTIAELHLPRSLQETKGLMGAPWAGVSAANLSGNGIVDLFCGVFWIKFDSATRRTVMHDKMLPEPMEMNWNQPVVADLRGDGKAEAIMGLRDGRIVVYETGMKYNAAGAQWGTCNGNFQHTGVWRGSK
ncbi:MAG TPA: sigma-70 family RNA polymerase sigma factor [Tepidisphaeraceae bacterium]|nr:sigma-70 family RNA polymerase sigma factor [Tepidisphaeraceae bacterium]